jgi:hypothetical protein
MRRPRAGFVTPFSGGPGQPSGPTRRVCLQWLDAAAMKGGGSCPGCRPEARRRGQKCRKRSAERRLSVAPTERTRLASVSGGRAGRSRGLASPCVFRRSAPLTGAKAGRQGNTGVPGACQRIRALFCAQSVPRRKAGQRAEARRAKAGARQTTRAMMHVCCLTIESAKLRTRGALVLPLPASGEREIAYAAAACGCTSAV